VDFAEIVNVARHGGVTLGIIGVFSLLALGVAIDRALAVWGLSDAARNLSDLVVKGLYVGDVAEARAACERSRTPFADVLLAAFTRLGRASPSSISTGITPGYRISSGHRPSRSRLDSTRAIASATRSSGATPALRKYSRPRSTS
jgi:hypothetical protein